MNVVKIIISCLLLFMPSHLLAYLELTHEAISEQATKRSVLAKDVRILKDMGLNFAIDSDDQQFPNSKGTTKSIVNLIKDGSNFEDSPFLRPINHFFDPISGEALLPVITKASPTWALEDKGSIVFPLLQRYSYADARGYFYQALTASNETERKKYFGLTFETLGRVIHHIQDMAQPQHVRLDAHLKLSDADREDWVFEDGSRYESYTKDNPDKLTPLFGLYPPVNAKDDVNSLTTARSFWHTGQGNGLGLAEFTNHNFVSADTNFDTRRYSSPFFSPATEREENANALFQSIEKTPPPECLPPNDPCVMTFYGNLVQDRYRPAETRDNPRASTWSIFDQDLKVHNKSITRTDPDTGQSYTSNQLFALNRFNFDEAHTFLIPRAVAYSAGLIDYFFRGKLDIEDAGYTDAGVVLRVKNAIDAFDRPETIIASATRSPS